MVIEFSSQLKDLASIL